MNSAAVTPTFGALNTFIEQNPTHYVSVICRSFETFKGDYKGNHQTYVQLIETEIYQTVRLLSDKDAYLDCSQLVKSLQAIKTAYLGERKFIFKNHGQSRSDIIHFFDRLIGQVDGVFNQYREKIRESFLRIRQFMKDKEGRGHSSMDSLTYVANEFDAMFNKVDFDRASFLTLCLVASVGEAIGKVLDSNPDIISVQQRLLDSLAAILSDNEHAECLNGMLHIISNANALLLVDLARVASSVRNHRETIQHFADSCLVRDSNLKRIAQYFLSAFDAVSGEQQAVEICAVIADSIIRFQDYQQDYQQYFEERLLIDPLNAIRNASVFSDSLDQFFNNSFDEKRMDPLSYQDEYYVACRESSAILSGDVFAADIERIRKDVFFSGEFLSDLRQYQQGKNQENISPQAVPQLFCRHTHQAGLDFALARWSLGYLAMLASRFGVTDPKIIPTIGNESRRFLFYPLTDGYGVISTFYLVMNDGLDSNICLEISSAYELTLANLDQPNADDFIVRCIDLRCRVDEAYKSNLFVTELVKEIQKKAALIHPWQRVSLHVTSFAYGKAINVLEDHVGYYLQKIAQTFCVAMRKNYSDLHPNTSDVLIYEMGNIAGEIQSAIVSYYSPNRGNLVLNDLFWESIVSCNQGSYICNTLIDEMKTYQFGLKWFLLAIVPHEAQATISQYQQKIQAFINTVGKNGLGIPNDSLMLMANYFASQGHRENDSSLVLWLKISVAEILSTAIDHREKRMFTVVNQEQLLRSLTKKSNEYEQICGENRVQPDEFLTLIRNHIRMAEMEYISAERQRIIQSFVDDPLVPDIRLKKIAGEFLKTPADHRIRNIISDAIIEYQQSSAGYFEETVLIDPLKKISDSEFVRNQLNQKTHDPFYYHYQGREIDSCSLESMVKYVIAHFSGHQVVLLGQPFSNQDAFVDQQIDLDFFKKSLFNEVNNEHLADTLRDLFHRQVNRHFGLLLDLVAWSYLYLSAHPAGVEKAFFVLHSSGGSFLLHPIENGFGVILKYNLNRSSDASNNIVDARGIIMMGYELTLTNSDQPNANQFVTRCTGLQCHLTQDELDSNPLAPILFEKMNEKAALIYPWQRVDLDISYFAYDVAIKPDENLIGYCLQKIAQAFCNAMRQNYSALNPDASDIRTNDMNKIAGFIKQAVAAYRDQPEDSAILSKLMDELKQPHDMYSPQLFSGGAACVASIRLIEILVDIYNTNFLAGRLEYL